MLVFISDIHLRAGGRVNLSRAGQFTRFWQRIEGARRGGPVTLCFVGDTFDLVRDPAWFLTEHRPYHPMTEGLEAQATKMIADTLAAEAEFFRGIKAQVASGALKVEFLLGNHDRMLEELPRARTLIRAAAGLEGGDAPFPTELRFPEERVLAYHGHIADQVSSHPRGGIPFSELFCPELITRFPGAIREELGIDHPHLDDIDDVRPVVAVPTWVRSLADAQARGVRRQMSEVWGGLVEEFLENKHVRLWFKENHRLFKFDFASKMKLMLTLSAKRGLHDESRFSQLHDVLFRMLDTKFSATAAHALEKKENKGLRYVVNGHTHFATLVPLGRINGERACYFNLGTWRTVHQLGSEGEPAFQPYDAMGYLAFFDKGDPLGRELEWWNGAAVARSAG